MSTWDPSSTAQPGGPPPAAWQQGPGGGYPPQARRGSGMATAALVLGIIGVVFSWTVVGGVILGLLALIFGIIGTRRAGRGEADGRGRAIAGIVLGALALVIGVGLVVAGASILNSKSTKDYVNCVNQANGNQAQVNRCAVRYRHALENGS